MAEWCLAAPSKWVPHQKKTCSTAQGEVFMMTAAANLLRSISKGCMKTSRLLGLRSTPRAGVVLVKGRQDMESLPSSKGESALLSEVESLW